MERGLWSDAPGQGTGDIKPQMFILCPHCLRLPKSVLGSGTEEQGAGWEAQAADSRVCELEGFLPALDSQSGASH